MLEVINTSPESKIMPHGTKDNGGLSTTEPEPSDSTTREVRFLVTNMELVSEEMSMPLFTDGPDLLLKDLPSGEVQEETSEMSQVHALMSTDLKTDTECMLSSGIATTA